MQRGDLLDILLDDVEKAAQALLAAPDAMVVHCPGWRVADLVEHHGGVQRWATRIVETGERAAYEGSAPADPRELASWYREGATHLVDVLRAADPDRDCWTFGRPPGKAWFWSRRQSLEAAIHRFDAEHAIRRSSPFPESVAVSGIDEVVHDLYPRQVDLGRAPALSAQLRLVASDCDRQWLLKSPTGRDGAPSELTGPAGAILLLLWRRTDLDDERLSFVGDERQRGEVRDTHFAP